MNNNQDLNPQSLNAIGTASQPTVQTTQQPLSQPPVTQVVQQPFQQPVLQATKANRSFSIKSIIIASICAFGVICFFLPWATASGYGVNLSANAAEIGEDYKYLCFFSLILLVISATFASTKIFDKLSLVPKIIISAVSGLAALFALIAIIMLLNDLNGYGSVGFGAWLFAIAAAASAGLAWIPMNNE